MEMNIFNQFGSFHQLLFLKINFLLLSSPSGTSITYTCWYACWCSIVSTTALFFFLFFRLDNFYWSSSLILSSVVFDLLLSSFSKFFIPVNCTFQLWNFHLVFFIVSISLLQFLICEFIVCLSSFRCLNIFIIAALSYCLLIVIAVSPQGLFLLAFFP